MERLSRFYPDPVILFCVILLTLMGFLTIVSVKVAPNLMSGLEVHDFRRPFLFALFSIFGLFLMSAVSYMVDYNKLYNTKLIYFLVGFSLFLLLIVFIKKLILGKSVERWLIGTSIQPSELSKLIVILFIAQYVARKGQISKFQYFFWAMGVVVLHASFLFLQPDKGMAILIGFIAWVMLWVGGTRPSIYLPAGLVIGLTIAFWLFVSGGYTQRRFSAWLDPVQDSFGAGYQVIQALIAFMNGGFWGQGYGKGFQKLGALTQADTDYILATIGEELGLPGIVFLLTLYVVLIKRLIDISQKLVSDFGRLVVFGITLSIMTSMLVNVMMSINLLPPKGIPLPFVSYGVSNLITNFIALGLVGAIYRQQKVHFYGLG